MNKGSMIQFGARNWRRAHWRGDDAGGAAVCEARGPLISHAHGGQHNCTACRHDNLNNIAH